MDGRARSAAAARWATTTRACRRAGHAGGRTAARLGGAVRARWAARGEVRDAGLATAEYAIVLIAAVGFAGLLVVILSSGEVREALMSLVRSAPTV